MVCQANSGKWSTVGGGVEPGESPAEAAKREVREETGLEIEVGPVRAAVGGPGLATGGGGVVGSADKSG